MLDPLIYLAFQPVLHDWCKKGGGMCYPVCGMVHIKESLLLIKTSSMWWQRISSRCLNGPCSCLMHITINNLNITNKWKWLSSKITNLNIASHISCFNWTSVLGIPYQYTFKSRNRSRLSANIKNVWSKLFPRHNLGCHHVTHNLRLASVIQVAIPPPSHYGESLYFFLF